MASTKVIFDPFSGHLQIVPLPSSTPSGSPNVVVSGVSFDPLIEVGDVVYMNNGIATQASAAQFSTSNAIGIVETKDTPTTCSVRTSGVSADIYSGLDTSVDYYLSDTTPGKLQTSAPTASGSIILRIGQAFSSTSFLINKSMRVIRS